MRTIKRDGFVMQTAYFWTNPNEIPSKVSLCKLAWRFTLKLPLALIFTGIFFGIIVPLISIVAFFLARRIPIFKGDITGDLVFYRHWPKVMGHRIYPIAVIGIPAVAYASFQGTVHIWNEIKGFDSFPSIALGVIVGAFALILIVSSFRSLLHTETGKIFTAWCKAKKNKVCPILEVTN